MIDRSTSLGGSDIPAVAGLDPYRTILDVYLEKTGQSQPKEETWPMKLGKEQESLVANWYMQKTGHFIQPSKQIVHPKYSWVSGTPDRIILENKKIIRGLECKFRSEFLINEYGEEGTDEVLPSEIAQCCWYLMVCPTAEVWDLAVQFGNRERRIYTIKRDEELIEIFLNIGQAFWLNHVVANVPPELDGSESARQYLNRLYPKSQGVMFEPTDPDILITVGKYAHAKKQVANWTDQAAVLEMRLKSFIGDAAGMKGDWGKITWKSNKNGSRRFYPQIKGV